MTEHRHTVPADDRLRDSRDKQVGLRLPLAIDQRLDDLVERANNAGAATNRREAVAALLLHCDLSGEDLLEVLRVYRTARVGDAALGGTQDATVLQFLTHKPGPRASRS